tara:strand:- start:4 stop:354 length:351 start_codon:yes stop_codon:yes gene_type:complete
MAKLVRSDRLRGRLYIDKTTYITDIDDATVLEVEVEKLFFDLPIMTEFLIDDALRGHGYRQMRFSFNGMFNGIPRSPPWDITAGPPTADDLAKHLMSLGDELVQAALVCMDELKEL